MVPGGEQRGAKATPPLSLDTTIVRSEAILFAQVGEELVALHTEQGVYIGLDTVGSHIWELLATPMTVGSLCERLVATYEVSPEVCRQETLAFVADLVGKEMLTIVAAAG
jgi:Coenzyme PQQ synthesis protein D (PqqD)